MDEPDFDRLRAERDAAIQKIVQEAALKLWGEEAANEIAYHVNFGGGSHHCYCGCPDGPCEHNFGGWREFERGGEQFCSKCGMGAMSHSVNTDWS